MSTANPSEPVRAGVWLRVSTDHQTASNQIPDVERFLAHHRYTEAARYEVSESAWNGGKGGGEYKATLQRALDDAWAGKFSVLVVWSLDRITREGAEGALRVIRQFSERGCVLYSVKESWLNTSPEIQDVLVAFAGWMANVESQRRSERIKAGLARRKAEGKPRFDAGSPKRGPDRRPRTKPRTKLTEDQVRQIEASTQPVREVAARYGISATHVSRIRGSAAYHHLTADQIRQIQAAPLTRREIAEQFGVSMRTVSRVWSEARQDAAPEG